MKNTLYAIPIWIGFVLAFSLAIFAGSFVIALVFVYWEISLRLLILALIYLYILMS